MVDVRLQGLLGSAPRDRAGRGPTDAIVVEQLAKTYPNGTDAVRGISFRVRAGEVFGILGPNGAGKSTTIGMLGTLVRPTGGRAMVAGARCREASAGGAPADRLRDAGGRRRRARD